MKHRHSQICRTGIRVLLSALALVIVSGCSWFQRSGKSEEIVFARLDSARLQYYQAAAYDKPVGRSIPDRIERLKRTIAAYQTVIDYYPDDLFYTPLAYADIANTCFRLGDYRKTIRLYQELEESYPCYPFLHAEAEWMIGQSEENLGRGVESKRHYKLCMDTFAHSNNEEIRKLVRTCKEKYSTPFEPKRSSGAKRR